MSIQQGPISENPINKLNSELMQYIETLNNNPNDINFGKLSKLEGGIQNLLKNKDIPPNVRKELQAALKDLKEAEVKDGSGKATGINMAKLLEAQQELNQAQSG